MLSKVPALLAAAALTVQAVPAMAQTESTPTSGARLPGDRSFFNSDIIVMLGAFAVAALINVALIAADGDDEPVSP